MTTLPVAVPADEALCYAGPGAQYPPLLQLHKGETLQLILRDHGLNWLEVEGENGPCWVDPDDLQIPESADLSGLPVALGEATPPPTGIDINFNADAYSIERGDCTTLRWQVRGATVVRLLGEEVEHTEAQEVCPGDTRGYTLRAETAAEATRSYLEIEVTEPERDRPGATCTQGPNDPCP